MVSDSSRPVVVLGSFDGVSARSLRLLQEAAALGPVQVQLWSDAAATKLTGHPPKCVEAERLYLLNATRYVDRAMICDDASRVPASCAKSGATWVVEQRSECPEHLAWCKANAIGYHVIQDAVLDTSCEPAVPPSEPRSDVKRVVVTGCYDWFHSGHVRFFEEVSQLGQLFVIVGHDANIRLLKGEGHPMFPATVRSYIAGSIRHVHQALISTGDGWLDAEPEIRRIEPDIYAVNEDGDRPEKRDYCSQNGIEYHVLKRTPKEGLPRRASTDLRGF